MMEVRSLRGRLTLVFTAVAGLVVLAAAIGIDLLVQVALWAPLDASLEEEAETLATIAALGRREELVKAVVRVGAERDEGPGKFIRVIDREGKVLTESGKPPLPLALHTAPAARATRFTDLGGGRATYRAVWYPSAAGGWIELGCRAGPQLAALHRARLGIGAGAAAVIAMLAILCWTITTHATGEIDRMAAELGTIEAGSLDRRLARRRTAEVDRLVDIMNRLLARLEEAVGHLRRFSADAAHELRTPIAALRAQLEVTLGRARSPSDYRDGLLDALEQAERLGRLAESLLTLSTLETSGPQVGPTELVALDALAREVGTFMEPIAQEERRHFECRAERRVQVRGAPHLLKRMMLNLVDNAFRHAPSPAPIVLVVREDDGTAFVEVADGGPGIPVADLPFVFERFRRGRTTASGAGLGLALCQEIVTRHGGRIELESAPGLGTRVTVRLPLAGSPHELERDERAA